MDAVQPMKNSADSNYKLSLSDDYPQMIQVVYSSLSGSLWILQKIKKKMQNDLR